MAKIDKAEWFLVLMIVLLVAYIIVRIWLIFEYADTPIKDLPFWVWLMLGGD